MKHTKGNWEIENISGKINITAGKKGFVIAEVTNKQISYFIGNEQEAEANAKLIAAAPSMIEALKVASSALELCRQFMRDKNDLSLWEKLSAPKLIEQAIQKATT